MPRPDDLVFPSRRERFEDRRTERQGKKVLDEFFDHRTLLAVGRLITQGQFEALDFPISTGKEGGVFRASGPGGFRAVKVYRMSNSVFKRLPAHALGALRREASERNQARLIYAWTRREHSLLRRLKAAGVEVPEPYGYLRNVLVMELVGVDGLPAPRLQDHDPEDPEGFYAALVGDLQRMVRDARLVHGDLSPYNVLVREDRPVLIDVAQAIEADHPQAAELLRRDITNFAKYLARLGVDTDAERFLAAVGLPAPAEEAS